MRTYSTEQVNPSQSVDYWHEIVCDHLLDHNTYMHMPDCEKVYGKITCHDLGMVNIREVISPKHTVKRNNKRNLLLKDEFALILYQVSGNCVFSQDGRIAKMNPGDISLYDSVLPHELHVIDDSYKSIILRVLREQLIYRVPFLQKITAIPLSTNTGMGKVTGNLINTLLDEIDNVEQKMNNDISETILDSIIAIINSNFSISNSKLSTTSQALLKRIKFYIQTNLRNSDITPSLIALSHKISVRYLNKLFETENTSVTRWICKKRLEQSAKLLTTELYRNYSIGEIAYTCGFNNVSYFNRKFKQTFNCSPTIYRVRRPFHD